LPTRKPSETSLVAARTSPQRGSNITVKDFDDPEARATHDIDFDLSDSARTDPQRHQHRRPDGG
jgi:hypothetical protein